MFNHRSVLGFAAALAILGLTYGTAAANPNPDHPYLNQWADIPVPNSDFSTDGSGGAVWTPPAAVKKLEKNTVLDSWSFASRFGGTHERVNPTLADYPGGTGVGQQVGRMSLPYGTNKNPAYLVSNAIPGVLIEPTRYRITVQVGNPHITDNAYKYGAGFLYGDTGPTDDYDSAADNWTGSGGAYWVAPWEINTGWNEPFFTGRPEPHTWVSYSWVWDNTGGGTPAIPAGPDPAEGYTPGYGIFTNQKHVGDQMRVGIQGSFRTYVATLDFDDIVVETQVLALEGDANVDNLVDTQDFSTLKANFGQSPKDWVHGDFNHDDLVDTQDFTMLKANFGLSAAPEPAPEPASLALLALAGLALLRRRRP